MRHPWHLGAALSVLLLCSISRAAETRAGNDLIGTRPSGWKLTHWINSPPRQLSDFRGKVVLVRWWTGPECPYCRATAPALNEFHRTFSERGLQVIGIYHHKSPEPLDPASVRSLAAQYGFEFPVGIDPEWRTLREWWLDHGGERWTSVSFLLDRNGVIRFIHPGGQYVRGDRDYRALKKKIGELLSEKPAGAPAR